MLYINCSWSLRFMNRFIFRKVYNSSNHSIICGGRKISQSSIYTPNCNSVDKKLCHPVNSTSSYSASQGLTDKAISGFQTRSATSMVVNPKNWSKGQRNEVDHIHIDKLNADYDNHDGVIVEVKENMDEHIFATLLQTSISQWRQQGKKGVWLKLSIEYANLVHPAVKEGFWYHHAEPTYLMLVYWIPKTKHTLPSNASHRVGVAAFVLNSKGEILVVQEKDGVFKDTGVWKLPTGSVEEGEDICTAAIREVKEEVGIDTEFVEVLAFRQSHMSFFSKSDIMFVCMLKPTSFDVEKQESEILAAKWTPLEEYANQPFVKNKKSFEYIAKICMEKKDNKYVGFTALSTRNPTSLTNSYVYSHHHEEPEPPSDSHIQQH